MIQKHLPFCIVILFLLFLATPSSSSSFSSDNWTAICSQISSSDGSGTNVTDIRTRFPFELSFGDVLALAIGSGFLITGIVLFSCCCFNSRCHSEVKEYRLGVTASVIVSLGIFFSLLCGLAFDELYALAFYKPISCQICWAGVESSTSRFTVGYVPDGEVQLVKTCYRPNCYSAPGTAEQEVDEYITNGSLSLMYKSTTCYYDTTTPEEVYLTRDLSIFGISGVVSSVCGFACFCTLFSLIGKCLGISKPSADFSSSEFPIRKGSGTDRVKTCDRCDTFNKEDATRCERCGNDFTMQAPLIEMKST